MSISVTKVSVFLRKVGESSSVISIPESGAAFYAANFSKLEQGNPSAIFDNSVIGYNGSGCMLISEKQGIASDVWPTLTYPLQCEKYGKYKLFIRAKAVSNTSFVFSILHVGQ